LETQDKVSLLYLNLILFFSYNLHGRKAGAANSSLQTEHQDLDLEYTEKNTVFTEHTQILGFKEVNPSLPREN